MSILAEFGPDDLVRIGVPLGIVVGLLLVVAFGWKGLSKSFKDSYEKGREHRRKLDEKFGKPR